MSKYLELFKGAFDDSIGTKTKLENKPYIGYSLTDGKMAYTVVPKPATGPADNEIWYTTVDDVKNEGDFLSRANVNVVSNVYENGKGIITLDGPLTQISDADGSPQGGLMEFDCKTLIFPDSLEYLGQYSISNSTIECISLPSGLKYISYRAISFSNFNYIIYRGTKDQWNQIEKVDDWYTPSHYFIDKIIRCTDGDIIIPANQ